MLKLRNNPNDFYDKAQELIDLASEEEVVAWANNPVTKALLLTLKGDYEGFVSDWLEGRYTDSLTDGTFQKSVRALGSVQAVVNLYEWIENIKPGADK
jgi:hypothetical protein